jgi:starch-binding outer membrane protein, SusD/RagB family
MKFIITKYKAFAVSVLLVFGACTNLDENIYDVLSDENVSEKDLAQMTGFVYNELRYVYWGWNGLFDINEESSDLIMTPLRVGIGWGDLYISMHKHTYHPNVDHFWTIWNHSYTGIGYANKLLDFEEVQANTKLSAEMRTMRALYYYLLFDCFRNVPIETTQKVEKGYLPTQAPPQETFDFIVSELQAVKEDLGTEKVYGYPNKYVASMILAKMYLNHNAWFNDHSSNNYYELALAEVNDIIDNGGYSLSPNYKDNFKAKLSGNNEIIFAIPLDYTYAAHNYLVNKCLIGAGAQAFGYNGSPWNGSCAVPQFMDTYHENDGRFNDTWAHGQQYHFTTGAALKTDADDQGEVNLVYTKEVHSIDNPGAYMLEGYRFIKNEIVAGADGTYGDDVPFFRLADAMFIKAECLLRLGRDQAVAADLITTVRQRNFDDFADAKRTADDLTGPSVYDYGHREWTSQGPKNYDPSSFVATYEGGEDIEFGGLLDDLAWEFVGEHHRRQDLIRFRVPSKSMNVYRGKSWFCKDAETSPEDVHTDIFPIHQSFVDSNPNMKQNDKY